MRLLKGQATAINNLYSPHARECREDLKMTKKTSPKKIVQKKEVGGAAITVLAVMGIVGLILLAVGVYAIFEISLFVGVTLLVLGFLTYIIFVVIEKKLKLL